MEQVKCKQCGKEFTRLLRHLAKSEKCQEANNYHELKSEREQERKSYLKEYQKQNRKEYHKEYREKNKEEIKANREKHKEDARIYRETHKEEAKDYRERIKDEAKAYRDKSKGKKKAYNQAYHLENAEKAKSYKAENSDEIRRKRKIYREENAVDIKSKKTKYDEKQKEEKQSNNSYEQRLLDFKASVKFGPAFPCISCEKLFFKNGVKTFKYPDEYEKLKEKVSKFEDKELMRCISVIKQKAIRNGNVFLCSSCYDSIIYKKVIPSVCHVNNLSLAEIPPELNLTTCEVFLIAKVILFLQIHKLPKSRMPALTNKVVCVAVNDGDIEKTVEKFPRTLDEGGFLALEYKRKEEYASSMFKELVRPEVIIAAVNYLKNNNPFYKNIKIMTQEEYAKLLEDAEKSQTENVETITSELGSDKRVLSEKEDSGQIMDEGHSGKEENEEMINVENDVIKKFQFQYSNASLMMNDHMENEVIINKSDKDDIIKTFNRNNNVLKIAPGEGKVPTNLMREKNWDVQAFPSKHPDGKNGLDEEREIKLTAQKYFTQRILNMDDRFSSDPLYVFAAYYHVLRGQLESRMHISCQRGTINSAGELTNLQNAFTVLDKVPGTFKFWKQAKWEMIAKLEFLGPFQFFYTLSCADKRWLENFYTVLSNKGHKVEYITESNSKSTAHKETLYVDNIPLEEFLAKENINDLMQKSSIPITRNFYQRIQMFRKYIMMGANNPLKAKYFNERVEFQNRGAAHVHGVIWTDLEEHETEFPGISEAFSKLKDGDPLAMMNKDVLASFIDKFVSCSRKNHISHIVDEVQCHNHTQSCRKNGTACRFNYPKYPSERTIIAQPITDCDEESKMLKLSFYEGILKKVKETLIALKNLHDITLSELLKSLDIDESDYYDALSTSANGTTVILKRDIDEIFVNSYNVEFLEAWNGNMDFQICLDYYQVITYITDYYLKSETYLMDLLLQAAKEIKHGNKMEQMKVLYHTFLKHRQVSEAEALFCLISSMHLKESNIGCDYVATGFPSTRSVFLSQLGESESNAKDTVTIPGKEGKYKSKPSIHEKYAKRPNVLKDMCLAQFAMMYVNETNNAAPKNISFENGCYGESPYQIVTWEGKTVNLPQKIKLSDNFGYMNCRKEPRCLRLHKINKDLELHEYFYSGLLLFHPWRSETELFENDFEKCFELYSLEGSNGIRRLEITKSILFPHLNNVEEGRQKVEEAQIKRNLHIGDILDPELEQLNEDALEEGATMHDEYEILSGPPELLEQSEENIKSHSDQVPDRFVPTVTVHDKDDLLKKARFLSKEQKYVFELVCSFCKQFIKSRKTGTNQPQPLNLIVHGGAGAGKSTIINTITPWIQYMLQKEGDSLSSPYVIKLAPTGMAALNIDGTTIHSGLSIHPFAKRHMSLSDKIREEMRTQYENLRFVIIDEFSMIKSDLLYQIHLRLQEIKMSNEPFGGVCIILFGDIMQLKPIGGGFVFNKPRNREFQLSFSVDPLWEKFQFVELLENHRQGEDKTFADLLNRMRYGEHTDSDIARLRGCELNEINYENGNDLYLFGLNKDVNDCNDMILDKLDGDKVTILSKNIHPTKQGFKPPIDEKTKNVKGTTLLFELHLKIGAKVMLTNNINTPDGLVNGARGNVTSFLKDNSGKVIVIFVRFEDEKVGLITKEKEENKKILELQGKSDSVPIKPIEMSFSVSNSDRQQRFSCKVFQFPLRLCWASTVHKVQGQTVKFPRKIVVDFSTLFDSAQAYVALSRVQSQSQLRIIKFDEKKIKCHQSAIDVAKEMKEKALNLKLTPWQEQKVNGLKITSLNIVSLNYHIDDLKTDYTILQSDVICLTETSLSKSMVSSHLNIDGFTLHNSDSSRGCGVAVYVRDSLKVEKIQIENTLGFQVIYLFLPDFVIVNVYKTHMILSDRLLLKALKSYLENLKQDIIILGDFNFHYKSEMHNILAKGLNDLGFRQTVTTATHIHGNILDHIYTKFEEKGIDHYKMHSVYYSDHCANCVLIT